jgi:hypothetical protein
MCRTYNNTVRDKNGPVTTLHNFRRVLTLCFFDSFAFQSASS